MKDSIKEYNYPFEELRDILSSFDYTMMDAKNKTYLDNIIKKFLAKITHKYIPYNSDFDSLVLHYNFSDNTIVYCGNLFTACVLYGRYVPLCLVINENYYIFPDGDYIEYNKKLQEYVYYKNDSNNINQ